MCLKKGCFPIYILKSLIKHKLRRVIARSKFSIVSTPLFTCEEFYTATTQTHARLRPFRRGENGAPKLEDMRCDVKARKKIAQKHSCFILGDSVLPLRVVTYIISVYSENEKVSSPRRNLSDLNYLQVSNAANRRMPSLCPNGLFRFPPSERGRWEMTGTIMLTNNRASALLFAS